MAAVVVITAAAEVVFVFKACCGRGSSGMVVRYR